MKKAVFLLIAFFFGLNLFSQTKKYYDAENSKILESSYNFVLTHKRDIDCLWINNKVYYFKDSPMDFLKGTITVIYDNVLVLPVVDKGYVLKWSLINNKLFIRDINIYRSDYETNLRPTKVESLNKLEDFLERKFEEIGLYADFVTGKFMLYKYPVTLNKPGVRKDEYTAKEHDRYRKHLLKKQEVYIVEFKDGELIKFQRSRKLEREFRKRLKF